MQKNYRNLLTLSFSHMVIDSFSGFFPIYIAVQNIDMIRAGTIATISSVISNFAQPFFGLLADKVGRKRMILTALLTGPLLMTSIGRTSSLPVLAVLVIAGQLMISLFHPPGADLSTRAATGGRSSLRFSIFTTAGSIGFAITALMFQRFTAFFGMNNAWCLSVITIIPSLAIFIWIPKDERVATNSKNSSFILSLKGHERFVIILYGIMVIRGMTQVALIYSMPSLFRDWGFPESSWSLPHLIFVFSGSLSMMLCGYYQRKFDPISLNQAGFLLVIPFFFLFLLAGTLHSRSVFVLVGIIGFVNSAAFPANVVLGQKRLPTHASTISGILMGAGWGLASFAPLIISSLSNTTWNYNLSSNLLPGLFVIGLLPLIGFVACRNLRKEKSTDNIS